VEREKMAESEAKRFKQTRENVIESLRGQQRLLEEEKALLEREESLLASKKVAVEDRERYLQNYQARIAAYREKLKNGMNPGIIAMVVALLKKDNAMTVQTLGRISTLTHHAYDDLLLPLWEEIYMNQFWDEDEDGDTTIRLWKNKATGEVFTDDQVQSGDSDDELYDHERYELGTRTIVAFAGRVLSEDFRNLLDSLTTPEKRYNESTYWKRAVEYATRLKREKDQQQIVVPWTPLSIPWVNSRVDKDGNIVFQWVEYIAQEKTARFYHRLDGSRVTQSSFMDDMNGVAHFQFGSEFSTIIDINGNLHVTETRQFRSVFFHPLNVAKRTVIWFNLGKQEIVYLREGQVFETFKPLVRPDGGYGFAVHPSRKYMCYIDQSYKLCFYNLETRKDMGQISTYPIPEPEMVGKLYWSPDGTRLYMSHKSGIVVYSFPDFDKPPVYRKVDELMDFELSADGSTLFLVSKDWYHFLDTSFSVDKQSRLRESKRGYDWEYVTSCFAANRPTVYIVERRKKDNFHRIVSIHAFAALVSVPYHD
jgi:hypothetical protein